VQRGRRVSGCQAPPALVVVRAASPPLFGGLAARTTVSTEPGHEGDADLPPARRYNVGSPIRWSPGGTFMTAPVPRRPIPRRLALTGPVAAVTVALLLGLGKLTHGQDEKKDRGLKAPELDGGVAWLNTAGPIKMKDLKGKIVLLDFWTFCCINCIHVLPDLAKLEKKYEKELVVIGVHSAKFPKEKDTEAIRKAVLRYEIKHPVINDANMKVWKNFQNATDGRHPSGWPTLILIDPEGNFAFMESGEGLYEELDQEIARLIKKHKANKTLNDKPMKFQLASDGDSPLFFPGKVVADTAGKRLFIADSTHHRVVITDLDGKKISIAGTGDSGAKDGTFSTATFNDPQGMALKGDTLYVADRKNHLIRALDLKKQTVKTVAGTGEQGRDRDGDGPALKTGLNSPWDLLIDGNSMYVAMAGHHQIWVMDLA